MGLGDGFCCKLDYIVSCHFPAIIHAPIGRLWLYNSTLRAGNEGKCPRSSPRPKALNGSCQCLYGVGEKEVAVISERSPS